MPILKCIKDIKPISHKTHISLHNVHERPKLPNCETPTDNYFEFLDHHLKSILQNGWRYNKDSGDFFCTKTYEIFMGLYSSIQHEASLRTLKKA